MRFSKRELVQNSVQRPAVASVAMNCIESHDECLTRAFSTRLVKIKRVFLLILVLNSTSLSCRYHLSASLNPLNAELNAICRLLALLGAHHIIHVSGLRVKQ